MWQSHSNILYDGELCLHGITLDDVQSFHCDTVSLDLAVKQYRNAKVLACQRRNVGV